MRRREFFALVGGAAFPPDEVRAQRNSVQVIGFLSASRPGGQAKDFVAFLKGLGEAGYVEGRNVVIEHRAAEDRLEQLPSLAADLVNRQVAVIVTAPSIPAALAAKRATQRIPIVFFMGGNPVQAGVVERLSRPGANVTGVTVLAGELIEKLLELMHELVPSAKLAAIFVNLTNPGFVDDVPRARAAARTLGIDLLELNITTGTQIQEAFTVIAEKQAGWLLAGPDPLFQRELLVKLAAEHAIPTSYPNRQFVDIGGLMSYAGDRFSAFHQVGAYVGRILAGETAAELPVQQPTKFQLVINLKTAKMLGLSIPSSIFVRADEVIE